MRRSLTSAFLLILTLSSAADPAAPPKSENTTASVANQASVYVRQRKLHDVGDVRVKIGSDGTFGSHWSGDTPDTADENLLRREAEATFEFPAKSHRQHSYIGGLWIAGIRDWDTLASRACAAGSGDLYDFAATGPMVSHMDSAAGYQRFDCLYFDTMASPSRSEPPDMPLGLEVHQTSHAFASPPYDRFVIIEYRIRNISGSTIHRPYVGFFDDCDIYNERATGLTEAGPSDDVSGFIPSRAIAYTIDNNGDPSGDSTWTPTSTVSAMGIAPIHFDPLPFDTSFNWWAGPDLNWGPSKVRENFHTRAVPTAPPNAYHVMANEELDYDQLWSTVDQRAEGWNAPFFGSSAVNIANGSDTRFLLSFGFRDLAPNDSIRIVIALAAGDSVHKDPGDFAHHFNANQPEDYYERLNFADLIRNVENARYAWAHNHDLYGAAPARLILTPIADDAVRCDWTPAPFYHVTGYRLLRRQSGTAEWDTVASVNAGLTEVVDRYLAPGIVYEYAVSSVDWGSNAGLHSRPVKIVAALPPDIPVLNVSTTPANVAIDCQVPIPPTGFSPYEYLNIYRGTAPGGATSLYLHVPIFERQIGGRSNVDIVYAAGLPMKSDPYFIPPLISNQEGDTLSFNFIDENVQSGMNYSYSASISNSLGFEGRRSTERSVLPMRQDRRGLIAYGGFPFYFPLVDRDSQYAFYGAWAEEHGFDTAETVIPSSQYRDSILSLRHLSLYESLIVVAEDQYGSIPIRTPYDVLETYARHGGKCIFVLRNHGVSYLGDSHYPDEQVRRLSGVTAVLKEEPIGFSSRSQVTWVRVEFVGARTADARYPDIEADSARGWDDDYLRDYARQANTLFAAGYTPAVGAIGGIDGDTQILYSYMSADDTSILHNKPIAVKRITDSTAAILFNFPLSLMNHTQAWKALTQAVADLGIDTANYNLPPTSSNRAIIEWLYGRSPGKPDPAWDVNRDGVIDIRDVVSGLDK